MVSTWKEHGFGCVHTIRASSFFRSFAHYLNLFLAKGAYEHFLGAASFSWGEESRPVLCAIATVRYEVSR